MGAEDRNLPVLVNVVVGFLGVVDMSTGLLTGCCCLVVLITLLVIGGLKELTSSILQQYPYFKTTCSRARGSYARNHIARTLSNFVYEIDLAGTTKINNAIICIWWLLNFKLICSPCTMIAWFVATVRNQTNTMCSQSYKASMKLKCCSQYEHHKNLNHRRI